MFTIDLRLAPGPQIEELRATGLPLADVALADTPFVFRCRPDSSDISVIYDTFVGLYHVPLVALRHEPVIVDLGCNIGCTLRHYDQLFPGSRLIGVDLDEANCELARHNCNRLGGRCTISHAAAWYEDGAVRYAGTEAWGYMVKPQGHTSVRAVSMPTLFAEQGVKRVDFLKVDIEGAERELFSGDLSWLDLVQAMQVELHNQGAEYTAQLLELLRRHGFNAAEDLRHWSAIAAHR